MPDRGYAGSLLAGKGHQLELSGTSLSTVRLQVGFCRLINTGRLAPIETDQRLYRLLQSSELVVAVTSGPGAILNCVDGSTDLC